MGVKYLAENDIKPTMEISSDRLVINPVMGSLPSLEAFKKILDNHLYEKVKDFLLKQVIGL